LLSGKFPNSWRTNTLTPLHKKGDPLLPSNYRGIAVSSNLSKLFCSILHNRLSVFISQKNLIPKNQIGYKKKSRTIDHILTLKNIIDKYIFNNSCKKLFACFVDFKSAFDTVNRSAMLYKLLKFEIGGTYLSIIQSMYEEVIYQVKMGGSLTENVYSNVGVKQGCVLSPTLFNLYLSDLPEIFDKNCHPISNFDNDLNCLMFADDIVLFSETQDGLQRCLNKLHNYCKKWDLTVNSSKTKVLLFNKGGHKFKKFNFTYGDTPLEIVQHYTYLGLTFSSCGTFTQAIKDIVSKSLKVFYKLRKLNTRDNALLTIRLFDSLVAPVLSYGCEIWAPLYFKKLDNVNNFMNTFEKCEIEKVNNKLCKYILGVGKYSTNLAVKGELGRYPLIISMLSLSVKYWMRTCSLETSEFVKMSYLDSICNYKNGNNDWAVKIYRILNLCDLSHLWEDQGLINGKVYSELCKSSLQQLYSSHWLEQINKPNSNKLRTYAKFKHSFTLENYVASHKCDKRRNFSNFRISAHKLAIETGRYTRPFTPECERICLICNSGCIENEYHVLLECPLY
jgi:hypothetical protein